MTTREKQRMNEGGYESENWTVGDSSRRDGKDEVKKKVGMKPYNAAEAGWGIAWEAESGERRK